MAQDNWRGIAWNKLDDEWDVIIIGGGITGAGILRLAAGAGLKALLVEARDFASGTSSRSSKLVHGGMRYLYNRQYSVTRHSVREREWLLRSAPGLVHYLPFLLPNYDRYHKSTWEFSLGATIYDLMAPKWQHRRLSADDIKSECSILRAEGLLGGCEYGDANVDDARLVLRVISEARLAGGMAVNYARAVGLVLDKKGNVCGIKIQDDSQEGGSSIEIHGRVVINAAGPWCDDMRAVLGGTPRLRKQRGSHLVFPASVFPLKKAVTLFHPSDRRALFAIPWETATIIGTTDIYHDESECEVNGEPFASQEEIGYLLEAVNIYFPSLEIGEGDILSTFAGVRPIIRSGTGEAPSKASRAHEIWEECGLVTITGGKLTTFRLMASAVMQHIRHRFSDRNLRDVPMFSRVETTSVAHPLPPNLAVRLAARYHPSPQDILLNLDEFELSNAGSSPYTWGEIRWSARHEAVVHLDDLLLRRTRLGILEPGGAAALVDTMKPIVMEAAGWDEIHWQAEIKRYMHIWQIAYSPHPGRISTEEGRPAMEYA